MRLGDRTRDRVGPETHEQVSWITPHAIAPPTIRIAWAIDRAMVRVTGGRRGIWSAKPGRWGRMKLTTVGRRSGEAREAILG